MSSDQFYSNANEHNSRMDMNDTKPKNSKQIIERVNKIGNDEGQLSETTTIKGVEGEEEIEWIEEGEDEEDARVELGLVNYNVEINNIDKNLFIFQFYQWKDKQRVLEGHPWHFNRYALILGEMEGKEKPSDISLCHLLMWVRVYNLPFKGRMNMVNVESIGKKIGTFVKMDNSGSVGIDKSIRIWVLIDARKPLMQKVEIKMRGGVEEAFDVKYEKPPLFCFVRGMLGHGIKDCEYWREEEDLPLKYEEERGGPKAPVTKVLEKMKGWAIEENRFQEEEKQGSPDANISKIRANEIGETEGKGNQITIDTEATCEIKAGVNYQKQGDGGKGKTWKRVQRQETQVKIIEGNIVGHKRTDRGVEADICEQMEIDNPVRKKKQIVDAIYPTQNADVDDVTGPTKWALGEQ
ncbi:ATP synthase gamma chain [Bienertia sinuspersici]